jgi:large subunit ribosomal protein L12
MEYAYATLILNETGAEINERNLTAVLEAAGVDVIESRVKAIVAALEDVDVDDQIGTPDAQAVATEALAGDESATSTPVEEMDGVDGLDVGEGS